MKRIALFPGSFDPFTLGHESVVRKALPLFDQIIIGIGQNSTKQSMFSFVHRKAWIEETFSDCSKISVEAYSGLTIDFAKTIDAQFILRGLRNQADYQYESAIAQMNQAMEGSILSVFIVCDVGYSAISSSIVREIFKNGGDVSQFLPTSTDLKKAK